MLRPRVSMGLMLMLLAICSETLASDAYVVSFNAAGRSGAAGFIGWNSDVLFYNTNTAPVTVRLLGISNGSLPQGTPLELQLPPGRTISLNRQLQGRWIPLQSPTLWVLHLDIPTGVIAESRDEFYLNFAGTSTLPAIPLGKVSMPIFRDLAPAGRPQIHLGTDLSGNDSRANIGIYNAGSDTATATIELRRTCDDKIEESRVVSIPANTITQVGGMQQGQEMCTSTATATWTLYTRIIVSQPSITYVSNVNENVLKQPGVDGIAPPVGLAVTRSESF